MCKRWSDNKLKFLGLKCVKEIIGLLTTGSVGRGNEEARQMDVRVNYV